MNLDEIFTIEINALLQSGEGCFELERPTAHKVKRAAEHELGLGLHFRGKGKWVHLKRTGADFR